MSGERIVLVDDAGGSAARLVQVTARLAEAHLGPHALVGGLAVMCRLSAVHRATQDIDAVTETTVPTALEMITSSIGVADPAIPDRALIDGVRVDLIGTDRFTDDDLDGIEGADRLFVISHRWALDTATATEIVAGSATASIRVAAPAALVATKAGALLGGRPREPHKRGSDLFDLYRLMVEFDRAGGIAASLEAAPFGLGRLVGDSLRLLAVDHAERAARWLLGGSAEMGAVTPDDLRDVFGPLADRLQG